MDEKVKNPVQVKEKPSEVNNDFATDDSPLFQEISASWQEYLAFVWAMLIVVSYAYDQRPKFFDVKLIIRSYIEQYFLWYSLPSGFIIAVPYIVLLITGTPYRAYPTTHSGVVESLPRALYSNWTCIYIMGISSLTFIYPFDFWYSCYQLGDISVTEIAISILFVLTSFYGRRVYFYYPHKHFLDILDTITMWKFMLSQIRGYRNNTQT